MQRKFFIIAHNHPSGSLEISNADKVVTQQLLDVADILGIQLKSHIILAKQAYTIIE